MSAYLYADGSESLLAMVKEAFATRRLTNAHNEWLTLLVNTGLLGAVSFAGMMVSAIWRYLGVTARCDVKDKVKYVTIVMACGFCLLAYTVNNMISFQQTMSLATISVVLGVGEHYCRKLK
jgi:O-antigen ligase